MGNFNEKWKMMNGKEGAKEVRPRDFDLTAYSLNPYSLGASAPYAEKLSPQEQWATALGLVTLKPPF